MEPVCFEVVSFMICTIWKLLQQTCFIQYNYQKFLVNSIVKQHKVQKHFMRLLHLLYV